MEKKEKNAAASALGKASAAARRKKYGAEGYKLLMTAMSHMRPNVKAKDGSRHETKETK